MADYPAIPTPTTDPKSLLTAVEALKDNIEALTKIRGSRGVAAVTFNDLIALGVIKTISDVSASANPTASSNYLDNFYGKAQGDILYRDKSLWQALAPGTNGQVLTTGGANANPAWGTSTPMSLSLLNTLTASNSATLVDTTSFTATYSKYLIYFDSIRPATNQVYFSVRVSTDGGATYQATSYVSACSIEFGGSSSQANTNTTTEIALSNIAAAGNASNIGSGAGYGLSGELLVFNPAGTTTRKRMMGVMTYQQGSTVNPGDDGRVRVFGFWDANTAINAIQFKMNSGNITSGTIQIYGIM
jgi:hypothetical protein